MKADGPGKNLVLLFKKEQGRIYWKTSESGIPRSKGMAMKRRVVCPSCKKECSVVVGDAGGFIQERCPGCGASLTAEKEGNRTPRKGPVRSKK
jgi:hypothetical protein